MPQVGERRDGGDAARDVARVVRRQRRRRAAAVAAPVHAHAGPVHHLQVVAEVAGERY